MEQLSGLDAAFVHQDSSRTPMHICAVLVYNTGEDDRQAISLDELKQLAAQRLAPIPLLHRKLHRVALGMDTPYWVDVAEPDWDRHFSESDLPGPPTALYLGDAELVVPIGLGPTRTSISNACKIPLLPCWGGR